jgi:putative membrane protein insertion efficiency factor
MNRAGRQIAHAAIRIYQLTFSAMAGRQCRHLPTCSDYTDEAIGRHGFWAGGWMGLARICRCHPWGTAGYDPITSDLPPKARWYLPWRYGAWARIPETQYSQTGDSEMHGPAMKDR